MKRIAVWMLIGLWVTIVSAQDRPRPGLFLREDWVESPPQLPVTQEHVANPALILSLHGPGRDGIKKSNHEKPYDDPFYIWNGDANGNWAVSLRHRDAFVDLGQQARIVWRSKQQGLRWLRMILKLADGTWLVSEAADGPSSDWRIHEFVLADTKWFRLNIDEVIVEAPVAKPDLGRVDEIGFTDLMRGGAHRASSRLDWIEVYGYPVPRATH
ncbi:MAG: hypothetical protein U5J83_13825 [Bryobacterales bacterium]|nr:hypothetical protein [Bryobacterales bacterium]